MKYIFVDITAIENNELSDQTQYIFEIYKIVQKLVCLSISVFQINKKRSCGISDKNWLKNQDSRKFNGSYGINTCLDDSRIF